MTNKQCCKGQVVVITGGAGVIGSCFARGIAEQGGVAVAADVDVKAAERLATERTFDGGGKIEAASLDITNGESIRRLIDELQQHYGRIDAVVNNAYPRNANYGRSLEDVEFADFCHNVDTHLGGYFLVAQQFCKVFREQGSGVVVNMSSIYGLMTPRFEVYDGTQMTMPVEYAAIKSAVIHLTRYFAQYFKGTGIRVNCLSPGGVLADQPESFLRAYNARCASKGMLAPQDLLGPLLFLLSDESRLITGQNIVVDDGFSL